MDYLKIDGSFIRNLTGSVVDREIVSSINDIGHRLGVQTVAESVEDEETLGTLRAIGVDYAQGYVIGRPVPVEQLLEARGSTRRTRPDGGEMTGLGRRRHIGAPGRSDFRIAFPPGRPVFRTPRRRHIKIPFLFIDLHPPQGAAALARLVHS